MRPRRTRTALGSSSPMTRSRTRARPNSRRWLAPRSMARTTARALLPTRRARSIPSPLIRKSPRAKTSTWWCARRRGPRASTATPPPRWTRASTSTSTTCCEARKQPTARLPRMGTRIRPRPTAWHQTTRTASLTTSVTSSTTGTASTGWSSRKPPIRFP